MIASIARYSINPFLIGLGPLPAKAGSVSLIPGVFVLEVPVMISYKGNLGWELLSDLRDL